MGYHNIKKIGSDVYDLDVVTKFCHEKLEGIEIEHCKRQEPCSMPLYHYHDSYEMYYLLSRAQLISAGSSGKSQGCLH